MLTTCFLDCGLSNPSSSCPVKSVPPLDPSRISLIFLRKADKNLVHCQNVGCDCHTFTYLPTCLPACLPACLHTIKLSAPNAKVLELYPSKEGVASPFLVLVTFKDPHALCLRFFNTCIKGTSSIPETYL